MQDPRMRSVLVLNDVSGGPVFAPVRGLSDDMLHSLAITGAKEDREALQAEVEYRKQRVLQGYPSPEEIRAFYRRAALSQTRPEEHIEFNRRLKIGVQRRA